MIKLPKQTLIVIVFLQLFGACDNNQNHVVVKQNEVYKATSSANIFGLYSYFVAGYNSHCESIKHSLRLNADSTFIFKIYCYADSTSPFPATVKIGKLTKGKDSVFNFICADKTSFKAEFLNDGTIQIISESREDKNNYPFKRDTTIDEKFWQLRKK
jgi:hypothetical protein